MIDKTIPGAEQAGPAELIAERQLCFLLHRCSSRFTGRWDRFLRRHNLTYTEYIVLLAVWESAPLSEHALAMRLEFDGYTLEDALANLERSRLVERGAGLDADGSRTIENTVKGLQLQPQVLEIRKAFSCEMNAPTLDVQALTTQLGRLLEALSGEALNDQDQALARA